MSFQNFWLDICAILNHCSNLLSPSCKIQPFERGVICATSITILTVIFPLVKLATFAFSAVIWVLRFALSCCLLQFLLISATAGMPRPGTDNRSIDFQNHSCTLSNNWWLIFLCCSCVLLRSTLFSLFVDGKPLPSIIISLLSFHLIICSSWIRLLQVNLVHLKCAVQAMSHHPKNLFTFIRPNTAFKHSNNTVYLFLNTKRVVSFAGILGDCSWLRHWRSFTQRSLFRPNWCHQWTMPLKLFETMLSRSLHATSQEIKF